MTTVSSPRHSMDLLDRWRSLGSANPLKALPALVAYLLVICVTFLQAEAILGGSDALWHRIHLYDGTEYRWVAEGGYPYHATWEKVITNPTRRLAFFPLYPKTTQLAMTLTGLDVEHALVLVAGVAAITAALGVFACLDHVAGLGPACIGLGLWGIVPRAPWLFFPYSESLSITMCAWTLYFILRRRWLVAGCFCLVAGLSRPTALSIVALFWLCLLAAFIPSRAVTWAERRRIAAGAVLGSMGGAAWVAFCAYVTQRIDGYTYVQSTLWEHKTFDIWWLPSEVLNTVAAPSATPEAHFQTLSVLALVLALVALVWLAYRPIRWEMLAYATIAVWVALQGVGYLQSKPRFMLQAFPLLLPAAVWLNRHRRVACYVLPLAAWGLIAMNWVFVGSTVPSG